MPRLGVRAPPSPPNSIPSLPLVVPQTYDFVLNDPESVPIRSACFLKCPALCVVTLVGTDGTEGNIFGTIGDAG